MRKHFLLRNILRDWNFIWKLHILKCYFLIMVSALYFCAYIFGNSHLCNFQTSTLLMMQMETCMHINASMFLQTGQSCWWCMAGICSIHIHEHVYDTESLDAGDRWSSLYSKQCACKRPGKKHAAINPLAIYNYFKIGLYNFQLIKPFIAT